MMPTPRLVFADPAPATTFDRQGSVTFEVSKETRTIKGLAVPFGVVGNNGFGSYKFAKGTLDWTKVKYLTHHDWSQAVGTVEFTETDEGLEMTAKIARGSRGDEVLTLTEDGVYDGLSIGLGESARFEMDDDGVYECVSATVREVSGTPIPAFSTAQVRSVAASAAPNKEESMKCEKCGVVHAAGVLECDATQLAKFQADQKQSQPLSAEDVRKIFTEEITKNRGEDKRPVVPAGRPDGPAATFQVREESIYRFDGAIPGRHDFAEDITTAVSGDHEAMSRVMKFMGEQLLSPGGLGPKFVTTGDTAAVNPARYRPDMFLDEGPAQPTPLYEFFYKGGLSDVTPFFYSKLGEYDTGLGDHTEGVDPTPGTFTTETGATITPKPISGQVHITREVHDQGGSPQVSGLIWSKFQRAFRQMLEARTFAILAGGTYSPFATVAAAATGEEVGAAIEEGVVDLQFLADGARFRKAFGHVDLYKALISAVDSNGRKLYPIQSPSNADGQSATLYGHVNVAGLRVDPTWSLGATAVGETSYVADPNAVHVWNSGLTKLERLNETVEGYDIGAWAYFAGIVYDATGVKTLDYQKGI